MMHRMLWLLAALAAALGVAVWFDRSLDPINPATFERIKDGMTREEVEVAIGKPPNGAIIEIGTPLLMEECSWYGKTYEIWVVFDSECKATMLRNCAKRPDANPSIPDRIRAWLAVWK